MKKAIILTIAFTLLSCNQRPEDQETFKPVEKKEKAPARELSREFKDYWYDGKAEISSYDLRQSRYGELREGTAIMIYVTEPFDAKDEVKADQQDESNIPVLKLNKTHNFNTGIYPYSIMSSTFLPLDEQVNALKISSSIQEWCGQTYMQFNRNGDNYQVQLRSYFQSEGNRDCAVDNVMTENQLALQLRLDPLAMPVDSLQIIPSAEFLRLKHVETKPYLGITKMSELPDGLLYSVKFPELGRTVAYKVEKEFPHRILNWMDRYNDGGKPMVSTASIKKTYKTAYWQQNGSEFEKFREEKLGL
jgi:hypothetical protein